MKKAIFAGSFDPLTLGHVDIIKRASKLFDEVIVLIGLNTSKKSLLSLENKYQSIRYDAIEQHKLTNVIVDHCEKQYTAHYAKNIGANFLIRGLRNSHDFVYEKDVALYNEQLNENIETVLLFTDNKFTNVSSSGIKSLIGFDGWENIIAQYLPLYSYEFVLESKNALMDKFIEAVSLLSDFPMSDNEKYNPSKRYYDMLLTRYSVMNNRHYHNMIHLVNGLTALDTFKLNEIDKALITVAYFYHDYQYSVNVTDITNIQDSIKMCLAHHKKDFDNIDKSYFKTIEKLILITEHKKEPHTFLERVMVDIDLISLSCPLNEYLHNVSLIRKEYAQYSDTEWTNGRKLFLNTMFLKNNLYHEVMGSNQLEIIFKQNIMAELNLLNSNIK